ncbi:MAG TPA: hypothetical protein VFF33_00845 [Ignavibacteriaceae bacterium]|nr:hypothetical protein [Ignavibacteriaceae bacterium]
MSNLVIYLIGAIIVAAALAYGAAQLGVNAVWIGVGVAVIIGLALMSGVNKTRRKEIPDDDK